MDASGNIRDLRHGEKPKPNEIQIDGRPNPHCHDCYGRGFVRMIILEKKPCHCVKKKKGK